LCAGCVIGLPNISVGAATLFTSTNGLVLSHHSPSGSSSNHIFTFSAPDLQLLIY
jgi:hypothetical protein